MIAINPLFERRFPSEPEIEDSGPMIVGLSPLLGEENDALCADDKRGMAIAKNALLHKAQAGIERQDRQSP